MNASVDLAGVRLDDIRRVLAESAWPRIRQLCVCLDDDVVTVTGYVGNYHEKQIACRQVQRVPGVRQVRDRVEVFFG